MVFLTSQILTKFCLLNLASLLLRATAAPLSDCWVWEDVDPDPLSPPFVGPTTCNPPDVITSTTQISTTPSQSIKECIKRCPKTPNYNPVCGSNGVTYGNDSKLKCAQMCGIKVTKISDRKCNDRPTTTTSATSTTLTTTTSSSVTPADYSTCIRQCPTTSQYNPVCGTNNMTYNNESHLLCAQRCGLKVQKQRQGGCGGRAPITTSTTLRPDLGK